MATTATLCTARLDYPPELALHTASSGRVVGLDAIYLHLERDGHTIGLGEMRENIEYLTGIPAEIARRNLLEVVEQMDFRAAPEQLIGELPALTEGRPSLVSALIDSTLHDAAARAAGQPLAEYLGGKYRSAMPSNQCIFWGSDAELEVRALDHMARGYRHIKLRVAVETFERDLERFATLRRICGPQAHLSVDANGTWQPDEAPRYIEALARYDLECVEQPLAAGAWDAVAGLARKVAVPIMLDEGAATLADVERIAALGGLVWAHLKLVKIGGISAMMEAVGRLQSAGVKFMVGQMNEGAAATAAAAHCAMATGGAYAELYGAYGIVSDPVGPHRYAHGRVEIPDRPGLGVGIDRNAVDVFWCSKY